MSKTIIIVVSLILIVGLFMFVNNASNISGNVIFGSGDSRVQCDDSDNIKNLGGAKNEHAITDNVFWKGNVGLKHRRNGVIGWGDWDKAKDDSCSGDVLTESYCDTNGVVVYQNIKCPYGCSAGKCNWPECSDLDVNENNPAIVASTAHGLTADDPDVLGVPPKGLNGKTYSDTCVSETKLKEYSCSTDRKVRSELIDCSKFGSYKCLNSKCVKS